MLNDFDQMLKTIPDGEWKLGLVAVADSCYMARTWFRVHGFEPTAADVLRFAELVLQEARSGSILNEGA